LNVHMRQAEAPARLDPISEILRQFQMAHEPNLSDSVTTLT
jgi:hypothetical protein